jgi:hypothetical protein
VVELVDDRGLAGRVDDFERIGRGKDAEHVIG